MGSITVDRNKQNSGTYKTHKFSFSRISTYCTAQKQRSMQRIYSQQVRRPFLKLLEGTSSYRYTVAYGVRHGGLDRFGSAEITPLLLLLLLLQLMVMLLPSLAEVVGLLGAAAGCLRSAYRSFEKPLSSMVEYLTTEGLYHRPLSSWSCVCGVLSTDSTDFQNPNSQPTRRGRSWAVVDGRVEFLSIQVCDGIIFRKNLNASKPSNY